MGILVICSYKVRPGQAERARQLVAAHVPTLRRHGLITDREALKGEGAGDNFVEVFEWASEEKSRMAPTIPEVGNLWKSMTEAMEFVPLASLAEAQKPFAHFTPA
jgi:hypothetical protein